MEQLTFNKYFFALRLYFYYNKLMKVLIIITHGKIGGATNFVFWLAKELKEKGINVKVGFGEGDYLKEKLEKENIDYINFKWLKRTRNPLSNIFYIFEIKKFLNQENFDIVHFNSTNALLGAIGAKLSKTKPKTVFTFHGLSVLDPNYKKDYLLKIIYWLIFKVLLLFVDKAVFVCKNNLEVAKKMKLIKDGAVIYNGIPEPNFLSKEQAKKFFEEKTGINLENKILIGSIGRLDYSKNYEFLIKSFPEILKIKENSSAIIIGEGEEENKLKKLIASLNLKEKIYILKGVYNANQYLKAFDLFVLPSRYEGLSITLIEALFAQIPILASDVGGNKEIIKKENTFKLNDKNDFLNKIKIVKTTSQIHLENFQLEKMVSGYLNLFKRIK